MRRLSPEQFRVATRRRTGLAVALSVVLSTLATPASATAADDTATRPARDRVTSQPSTADLRIAAFINELGSPSSAARDKAVNELIRYGRAARPALLRAARDPVAQRRKLAQHVLSRLPLFDARDPTDTRNALLAYHRTAPSERAEFALTTLRAAKPANDAAVARILLEERSDAIRWAIAAGASQADRERLVRDALAPLVAGGAEATGADEPMTPVLHFLLGSGAASPAQRIEHFRRCLDELTLVPPAATPAVMRIANVLSAQARQDKDAAREIDVRRRVALLLSSANDTTAAPASPADAAPNGGNEPAAPPAPPQRLAPAVESYLATRLRLRDAAGVEEDLQSMGVSPKTPLVQLLLAVLAGKGPPATTAPVELPELSPALAQLADALDPDVLVDTLTLLGTAEQWPLVDQLSARALQRLGTAAQGDWQTQFRRAKLELARYALARARADTKAAAQALQSTLAALPENGSITRQRADGTIAQMAPGDLFAELYIEDVKRAMRADDKAAIESALDALERLTITNSTLAIDSVYLLELHGRVKAADEIAGEYLADQLAKLDENPDDVVLLNGTAWYAARTGRMTERAYAYAAHANDLLPNAPSMMDTLAEASFRIGKVKEAIDLERRALQLNALREENVDAFMTRQLARFQAGLQEGDATRALPSEDWVAP